MAISKITPNLQVESDKKRIRFNKAFSAARKSFIAQKGHEGLFDKDAVFEFEGKKYHMRRKGETPQTLAKKANQHKLTKAPEGFVVQEETKSKPAPDIIDKKDPSSPYDKYADAGFRVGKMPDHTNYLKHKPETELSSNLSSREEIRDEDLKQIDEGVKQKELVDIGRYMKVTAPSIFDKRYPLDEVKTEVGYNPIYPEYKDQADWGVKNQNEKIVSDRRWKLYNTLKKYNKIVKDSRNAK